ncbi:MULTISPECIES: alanine--tRNA ligase-related protein [unclassified Bradyrhizobium]|uniref:alanine--tRNA ligase-related protein n=1 Tax=unclassified Bradyrhizobium TaxID=2631580 RepID=UPI002916B4D7|nr:MULTISPECIES: alanine--tRNA ligase-related protein [unclassified Bradyrhizobium]
MSQSVDQLGIDFTGFFAERGYRIDPPVPLLSDDPSLLFTNASVTPYKQRMLEARAIAPSAVVQPCLRSNCSADRLSHFTMFGLIADYSFLTQLTADLQDFLTAQIRRPGRFVYRPCAGDDDLIEAWRATGRMLPDTIQPVPPRLNLTRWRYGMGESLLGKGGGIAVVAGDGGDGPDAHEWILGTLIAIASAAGRLYVEVAIGGECLAAAKASADLFALPPISDMVTLLMEAGLGRNAARHQADAAMAVAALVVEGCTPGPRGSHYLMRKYIHRIDPDSAARLGDALLLPQGVLRAIRAEHVRRAQSAGSRRGATAAPGRSGQEQS